MDGNMRANEPTLAFMDANIQIAIDDDGILLATIDMPGRAMNVFSPSMMDSLEHLLDHVERAAAVCGVVLTSGKPVFLAGADLDMIRMFAEVAPRGSHADLHALFGRLGRLFRRMEKSRKPYVAAINGLALGGGLEVALACHARVVADDPALQLGLPEIKLGLLPGAGGTQRLPRLIGTAPALHMLLTGAPVAPARALELGLVDELAAPGLLIETAKRRARELGRAEARWDVAGRSFSAAPFDFSQADAAEQIAELVGIQARRARYPAYDAIIRCVVGGWNRPMDEAGHWEMDVFVDLMRDPVAGNMVRTLFLNRLRAVKEGQAPQSQAGARVALAGAGADVGAVRALLEKGRAPIVEESAVTRDDIVLEVGPDAPAGGHIAWLRGYEQLPGAQNAAAGVWLSDASEHGRVLEIVLRDGHEELADAGKKLAQWLRATVLVTRAPHGLLFALSQAAASAGEAGCGEEEVLLAMALAGARIWLEGGVADTDIADVAAVLAGVAPAYTGGPFTYLRQTGRARIELASRHRAALFHLPPGLDALFNPIEGEAA